MHDELEARIVRALRAEADSLGMTVTPEQIEERLSRSSGVPWLAPAVAALGLVVLVLAVSFGLASLKFAGVGEAPLVEELPVGTWVSNSAFRSGSICFAIEVDDPMAESHSAWWWNPGGSGDCSSRSSSVVQAGAATDEFPMVRVELPSMSEQGPRGSTRHCPCASPATPMTASNCMGCCSGRSTTLIHSIGQPPARGLRPPQ